MTHIQRLIGSLVGQEFKKNKIRTLATKRFGGEVCIGIIHNEHRLLRS